MRGPFLEFLRNLTPQILLFSIAIVLRMRLNLSKFDLTNWADTLAALGAFIVLVAAIISNMSLFMENICRSLNWVEEKIIRLRKRGYKGKANLTLVTVLAWRTSKIFVIEVLIGILVIQVGAFAVGAAAVNSVITLYKTAPSIIAPSR